MDKVVGEQLRIGIFNVNDLGMYYRSFFNITHFPRTKNRISEAEQSRAFVHGFQPALWTCIARHLELKHPDHYPDDPYPLDDMHKVARFVLAGTSTSPNQAAPTQNIMQSTSTSAPSPLAHVKQEDLALIFDKFAATIVGALTGTKGNGPPHAGTGLRHKQIEALICIFCGLTGHFIGDCLTCQTYINEGKCKRNAEGKVVLLNGQYTPRSIPGCFIKEHVNEWLRRNPKVPIVPALMYGIALPQNSTPTPKGIYQVADITNNDKEHIVALKQELFALQSGKPFSQTDNCHNAALTSRPSTTNVPAPGPQIVPNQSGPVILTPPPSTSSMATNPSTLTSQPPIHPYTSTKENAYLPPHERNFASGLKGKE
jgi:hypothetical protein